MTRHLHRDLDALQRELLALSGIVEEMIIKAKRTLTDRRYELVDEVIASDQYVDQREVHIEEECLKILALHQPVAIDLRRIATVLKVNNDLERIADLAVNIAERAHALEAYPEFLIPSRMDHMGSLVVNMVRGSLDAFVNLDTKAARRIMGQDDEIDSLNVSIILEIQEMVQLEPEVVVPALHCFSASRHIERIADHATNIAEDVVYLVEGDIVRHRHASRPTKAAR